MAAYLLPVPKDYCYTLSYRTDILIRPAEYTTPPVSRPTPRGRYRFPLERISLSKKPGLTREQENGRTLGLRLLARIIARHYLEHPDLYPRPVDPHGDGNLARKEAAQ